MTATVPALADAGHREGSERDRTLVTSANAVLLIEARPDRDPSAFDAEALRFLARLDRRIDAGLRVVHAFDLDLSICPPAVRRPWATFARPGLLPGRATTRRSTQ